MALILEIKAGPFSQRKIAASLGQSVLIGRAPERAQFAVPHDNKMSGVHFAVECGPGGCRVIDKKSTNGTFLNGARIQEATLANGDEIKSGQTIFVVHIVPDAQLSPSASSPVLYTAKSPASPAATAAGAGVQLAALAIGGWAFPKVPERWQIQDGIGIQQVVKDAFPASISTMEEPLGPGLSLARYVEAHTQMFREHLPQPKIDVVAPPSIRGSEETAALEIRFTLKDGPAVYWRRIYVRAESTIGVVMLTTLEKDLSSVRSVCDSVLSGMSFSPKAQA